jgi:hypothetical protein
MITYEEVVSILNRELFGGEIYSFLHALAFQPQRFTGIFRYTSPRAKLLQYLLQSREIRFGNAWEQIVEHVIVKEFGWEKQEKKLSENLYCDFLGKKSDTFLMIEQKIRDDHDSTKKRGQIANFEHKVKYMFLQKSKNKDTSRFIFILYFIDPYLQKNRRYYEGRIKEMRGIYEAELHVHYGRELFEYLENEKGRKIWEQLLRYLERWKEELPELPSLDLDREEVKNELQEVAKREPIIWRRIAEEESLWREKVISILFPSGNNLRYIAGVLEEESAQSRPHQKAWLRLRERIRN